MFIRKKKNRSGTTSVVVVNKHNGIYREIHTIGVGKDQTEIDSLCLKGLRWIESSIGNRDVFEIHEKELEEKYIIEYLLSNVENVLINGTQLILNQVFKLVGFDAIEDEILKQLVIARLSQPMSKLATVDYLKSHFDEDVQLYRIYRYLDKLYNTQQELIQKISVEHTKKILGGKIGLMFYDVTTLYFETDNGDELRESGFSKDGKHSQPQVVLGLLVSKDGYPLSYSVFNGSQYEGRTMLPVVEDFVQRFALEDFVVVADSGLMNRKNIAMLESGGHKYIIGARIKNEEEDIKQWILSLEKADDEFNEIHKGNARLIVGYSQSRAKKDRYNREKGVERLKKAYKSGSINKENINKRGYNKFLEISENVKVTINQEKISDDQKWDGLKGFITNTTLSKEAVIENYGHLWQIEKAFRVAKTDLKIRPIYHYVQRRIEAHICIAFVAYKIYKELERLLKEKQSTISPEKAIEIAKTIYSIKAIKPNSKEKFEKTLLLNDEQRNLINLFYP